MSTDGLTKPGSHYSTVDSVAFVDNLTVQVTTSGSTNLLFQPGAWVNPFNGSAAIQNGDKCSLVSFCNQAQPIRAVRCDDLSLVGITVNESPSVAAAIVNCGGVLIDEFYIVPAPPNLRSVNRGGLRTVGCHATPSRTSALTITNCEIDSNGDDALMTPGDWFVLADANVFDPNKPIFNHNGRDILRVGDQLVVYDPTTHSELGRGVVAAPPTESGEFYTIPVTGFPPGFQWVPGALAASPEHLSPGFIISGNHIRNPLYRGILIRSIDGEVIDNVIEHCPGMGIVLGPSLTEKSTEAGWVEEIVVSGNTIRNVGFAWQSRSPYLPQPAAITIQSRRQHAIPPAAFVPSARNNTNICIFGNRVVGSAGPGLAIDAAQGVDVYDNAFLDLHFNPIPTPPTLHGGALVGYGPEVTTSGIYVANSENVSIFDNDIDVSRMLHEPQHVEAIYVAVGAEATCQGNRSVFYTGFEPDEGFTELASGGAVWPVPQSSTWSLPISGTNVMGESFGLTTAGPQGIENQWTGSTFDGGRLRVRIDHPRTVDFKAGVNTIVGATATWSAPVDFESIPSATGSSSSSFSLGVDGATLPAGLLMNSTTFFPPSGSFTDFHHGFPGADIDLARGPFWVSVRRLLSSGSPDLHVEDLMIEVDDGATGFEALEGNYLSVPAQGWPLITVPPGANSAESIPAGPVVLGGLSFELKEWSVFRYVPPGAQPNYHRLDQGSRCDIGGGELKVEASSMKSLTFSIGTNGPAQSAPTWGCLVEAYDETIGVWTVIGAIANSTDVTPAWPWGSLPSSVVPEGLPTGGNPRWARRTYSPTFPTESMRLLRVSDSDGYPTLFIDDLVVDRW